MTKNNRPFNELTNKQMEILDCLAEECAEVIMAIAKIKRHGLHNHHPDNKTTDNKNELEREIGDVLALIGMTDIVLELDSNFIEHWAKTKPERMERWLHHYKETS